MPTNGKRQIVHVLWINAGLSCDGDSVSITAATQPSIEDVVLGAIPGLPKVRLHTGRFAYETGEDFLAWFWKAARGELEPFVLVVEGSIPNEKINGDGYWAGFGNDPETGQPMTTERWIDELAPQAAGGGRRRHLRHLRRHPRHGRQPDRRDGPGRLPRAGISSRRRACRSSTCPAARCSPTTSWRRCSSSCTGRRPGADDPARREPAPDLALRQDRARGLRPRRLLRAGRLRAGLRLAQVHREARLLGPGGQLQRPQARLDGRHRRLPQRRRHLHRLHHARLPRQVHAVHGRAAGRQDLVGARQRLRRG